MSKSLIIGEYLKYNHFTEVKFMTLTKRTLSKSLDSMRILATDRQKSDILKRFGAEPTPYEWSEQDIFTQIQNFIDCGEFARRVNCSFHQATLDYVPF